MSVLVNSMPKYRYSNFTEAEHSIINYIACYYSQLRPHLHNNGNTPKEAESLYFKAS